MIMDEMKELNRIWESLEARLASISGDQERDYNIVHEGKIIGTVLIPVNADNDDVIEILKEWNTGSHYFQETNNYDTLDNGNDDEIKIDLILEDEPSYLLSLVTNDEIEDFDQFMDDVLDINREQYLSGGKWCTKEYTIVTGTGGPHVEFTTGYSLHVYWGGKSLEAQTYNDSARETIDRIEDYLNDIYGE